MIEIPRGDITTLAVDAIVNAADAALRGGGGVDGAIHRAAGPGLHRVLLAHDGCETGDAVLTGGHAVPARYVVHTVGPAWQGGDRGEPALLDRAHARAFDRVVACLFDAESVAIYRELLGASSSDVGRRESAP